MTDIEKYLQNNKTSYLAETFKKLEKEEESTKEMIASDPSLADLAKVELIELEVQKDAILKQVLK
jgi:protein subunit release factor A